MRTGYSDKLRGMRHTTRRVSADAMLIAVAFMISFAETLMPVSALFPGFKPGMANLAVMAALCISPFDALAVSLGRLVINAIFFGNFVSWVMSFLGAISSLALLFILRAVKPKHMSWIGVSYLSALFHNGGQLAAACAIISGAAALSYAPVLVIFSVVCGVISGIIMNHISPVILKIKDRYFATGEYTAPRDNI